MKSTKTIYLTTEVHSRDRQLIDLLSECLDLKVIQPSPPPRSGTSVIETTLRAHAPSPSGNALLWLSRLEHSRHIPLARSLGFQVLLDHPGHPAPHHGHPVSAMYSIRQLARHLSSSRERADEKSYCEISDAVIVRSNQEAIRLNRHAPGARVHVFPSPIEAGSLASLRSRPGNAILLAGDYRDPAQLSGLRWFVRETLPFLHARYKSATPPVLVAHESEVELDPSEIGFLRERPEITFRHGVKDFREVLGECGYFVIPSREESRSHWRNRAHDQTRILQAMDAGRAVVSTGIGASGLVLSPTYDVWIADAPDRFACALIHLLDDEALRAQMIAHAIQTVESRYDRALLRPRLEEILGSILLKRSGIEEV